MLYTRSGCPKYPTQPGLEYSRGMGIHSFFWQLIPLSPHPHQGNFLPYIQFKSTLVQFKAIVLFPVITWPGRKSFSLYCKIPPYIERAFSSPSVFSKHFFSPTATLSACLRGRGSSVFSDHFVALLWMLYNRSTFFLCWGLRTGHITLCEVSWEQSRGG